MKEGYFIYNSSTILKGTIEEKVFRIEAENPNAGVRGYILVNPQFISSMYYRYYYIMSVKCNYKGVSFHRTFCRLVEEVYDNPDDLISGNLNKKPNLRCIDEYWVKKVIKKADLKQDGFTMNQNFDIVPVHMNMPIIKYEPVHVDLTTPKDICKNVITVYRNNYKVEGLYVIDDFEEQAKYKQKAYRGQSVFFTSSDFIKQKNVFFTIEDAIEAKKKRFKVKDVLEL